MPRRLKLKTIELGDVELFLIYQYGEKWESEWLAVQGAEFTKLFTVVTEEVMTHALKGWTRPLIKTLGIEPEGAIRRLPVADRVCWKRDPCPFYRPKECVPTFKKMPWCFEPGGIENPDARTLAGEAVQLWRQGVYILVVVHA